MRRLLIGVSAARAVLFSPQNRDREGADAPDAVI